jgi:hypothetical protein
MKSLVWLASYPKSGNTWIRAILTAYLTDVDDLFDFKSMDPFTRSESSFRDYIAKSGKPREQLDDETIDSLRKEVQLSLAANAKRPFWVKTHNANIVRHGQRLIYPEYTFAAVYIVRNPLDVVDSLSDHSGRTIEQAIELLNDTTHALGGPRSVHVKQYLSTWSQHVCSWIDERDFPVLVIRYEDLHANTFADCLKLIQFLGWPLDEERLRRALSRTSFAQLQAAEQERGFAERNLFSRSGRFFRRGQSGCWQSVLNRRHAAEIIAQHAETMAKVGYSIPDLESVYSKGEKSHR